MAEPTEKHPDIEKFLNGLMGRTDSIKTDKCVDPPFGCGGPANKFRDALSQREYTISGLCQNCQDEVFGTGE
jgi:hypothetical protein